MDQITMATVTINIELDNDCSEQDIEIVKAATTGAVEGALENLGDLLDGNVVSSFEVNND